MAEKETVNLSAVDGRDELKEKGSGEDWRPVPVNESRRHQCTVLKREPPLVSLGDSAAAITSLARPVASPAPWLSATTDFSNNK